MACIQIFFIIMFLKTYFKYIFILILAILMLLLKLLKREEMAAALGSELLRLLQANESGLSDQQISSHFGSRYSELEPIINDLLGMNRMQLFTQNGMLVYKIIQEETAAKFDGLG